MTDKDEKDPTPSKEEPNAEEKLKKSEAGGDPGEGRTGTKLGSTDS